MRKQIWSFVSLTWIKKNLGSKSQPQPLELLHNSFNLGSFPWDPWMVSLNLNPSLGRKIFQSQSRTQPLKQIFGPAHVWLRLWKLSPGQHGTGDGDTSDYIDNLSLGFGFGDGFG